MTAAETEEPFFAEPIGLKRDPHAEDAWTVGNTYVLPHPDDPSKELVAGRASELGKTISNPYTLNMWHQRMVAEGMAMRPRLGLEVTIAKNAELTCRPERKRIQEEAKEAGLSAAQVRKRIQEAADRDGLTTSTKLRKKIQDVAGEAHDIAGGKEPAALGVGYHKLSELIDAGQLTAEEVPEPWHWDMIAYSIMLRKMGIVHVPEFTEKIIYVRRLNIAGKFDRLVRYLRHCDKWHVEDLKSGQDMQYGWGENPVQFQVYSLADLLFDMETRMWSPAPEICQELALLHHLPVGGLKDPETKEPLGISQSVLYEVDLTTTIDMPAVVTPADLCIGVQQWHKTKRVGKPVARIQVTSDGEVIDSPLTWTEQIDLAGSVAELEAIKTEAKVLGEWRGHHTTRKSERESILSS